MIKFELGKKYKTTLIVDSSIELTAEILKRTDKTVWIKDKHGDTSRHKVRNYYNEYEYFDLGNYSMAPGFSADRVA
jgi:hypothetical protein